MTFLAVLMLVQASAPAAAPCPAPNLQVSSVPAASKQGGIVAVTIRSSAPLSRVVLSDGKHEAEMERDDRGSGFRALWGVDFESAAGAREVRIEAVGMCGDEHASRWDFTVRAGKFLSQQLKVDPAYVEPPPEELERIRQDREKVARVWVSGTAARLWSGPFRLPVNAETRGNFGARRIFNGQPRSRHEGLDLAAPAGAPVEAPAPAIVALAEDLYFSGGTVILDHGAGLFTQYFHLSRIDVEVGQRVRPGEILGLVGATGRVTGPHLHWGARLDRARVNPLDLLRLPNWGVPAAKAD